jgi:hypothetical protein
MAEMAPTGATSRHSQSRRGDGGQYHRLRESAPLYSPLCPGWRCEKNGSLGATSPATGAVLIEGCQQAGGGLTPRLQRQIESNLGRKLSNLGFQFAIETIGRVKTL